LVCPKRLSGFRDDFVPDALYPALSLRVSSILADLLREHSSKPSLVAGHSLGEYVALYAAKVFDFESGLRLVKHRAELMSSASGGIMAALIGFDRTQLHAQIQQTPDVVIANDNHESQVVISGTTEAVEAVLAHVTVKRAVRLNVSGAFHSPLMADAAQEFRQLLETVPFQEAETPVLSNVEPTPAIAANILKERLHRQITGSVRWTEISQRFSVEGIEQVLEVGPGKVLTGLIKRTCPNLQLANVQGLVDLKSAVDALIPA
jgi:[acyl-carrier-protein] S-malonyltransferase